MVDQIHVDDKIRDYIVKLVLAFTRKPADFKLDVKHFIQFGASPRATIYLTLAAKAWALLQGRDYVIPEDIMSIGPGCLAAPDHPDLRSRGPGGDHGRDHPESVSHRPGAVN